MESNPKKLVDEILETEKTANVDLEAWDWRTRPGMTVAVRDAQERLEALKRQYAAVIGESTLGIFALGPDAATFGEMAREESVNALLIIDAEEMYRILAEPVEKTFGTSREFSVTQMGVLLHGIDDLVRSFKLDGFAVPPFMDTGPLPTFPDVIRHVRRLVRSVLGDRLNRAYLIREITNRALALRYSSGTLPVVIIGLEDAEEAAGLEAVVAKFGARVHVPDHVNKEFVIEIFQEALKRLRKQPKNKTKTEPEEQ